MSLEEITSYVAEYSPLDKAGSYGIQERIGLIGIEKIYGSYTNVVGLPTEKLYAQLINLNK
jgi:septum formation protein